MAREDDFSGVDEMVPFELTSNANTQRKEGEEEDGVSPNAIVVVEQVDYTVAQECIQSHDKTMQEDH